MATFGGVLVVLGWLLIRRVRKQARTDYIAAYVRRSSPWIYYSLMSVGIVLIGSGLVIAWLNVP
jgi:hypothetical protein